MNQLPTQFPASQRTSYQFPIYRWIGWLTVAGFAIGLTVMFFISDMFGVPAPLGWASLVIMFTVGALLLDRPKLLLNCMLFYFLLMPGNRLFGILGLPLPGFIDELFFLPFIAVIVMNWIQRRQLQEATLFPLAFCLIAVLSWYVNRPSVFTAVQVTLIMLKSYIIWYYCRLTCTFENERHLSRWVWAYILYVGVQFGYNVLWHGRPWLRFHADVSGGVFGPFSTGGAHIVGYLSVFGLLLLMGWWVSEGRFARPRRKWAVALLTLVVGYNLIFMTDTKHALFVFPFAAFPFLMHPKFPARIRINLVLSGIVFIFFAVVYFQISGGGSDLYRIKNSLRESPKGEMMYAVTTDFRHLVPYPLIGAGPGRFASNQAVGARAPLARRYIIPHLDKQRRMGYFKASGTLLASSILGMPQTDFFVLMGEFGWLGAAAFYSFLGWVIVKLWRKSASLPLERAASGYFMALCCCLVFFIFTTLLMNSFTIGVLSFPLWILIGRMWDMKPDEAPPEPEAP
jgi:hypothetical protein